MSPPMRPGQTTSGPAASLCPTQRGPSRRPNPTERPSQGPSDAKLFRYLDIFPLSQSRGTLGVKPPSRLPATLKKNLPGLLCDPTQKSRQRNSFASRPLPAPQCGRHKAPFPPDSGIRRRASCPFPSSARSFFGARRPRRARKVGRRAPRAASCEPSERRRSVS